MENWELKRVTPHYVCFITTCTHLRGIVWCAMAFVVFHRRYSLFECDPAVFVVRFNYFYDDLMFVSNDLNNELICYLLEIRNFNIWQCDSCAQHIRSTYSHRIIIIINTNKLVSFNLVESNLNSTEHIFHFNWLKLHP